MQALPVRCASPLLVLCLALPAFPQPLSSAATLDIDISKSTAPVSPILYGLMTEEINFSYDGGLYAEEVFATKGCESFYSLLYHLRPPTATLEVREWKRPAIRLRANDPLRNRHFKTAQISSRGDAIESRTPLLGNSDILISVAGVEAPMEYFYRNVGGDELLFTVRDDGPGIAPEERERVFERFHRTDPARSRVGGGAGLGLAIVRAIVQAHGGQVSVRGTEDGRGARLEMRLPRFLAA